MGRYNRRRSINKKHSHMVDAYRSSYEPAIALEIHGLDLGESPGSGQTSPLIYLLETSRSEDSAASVS